MDIEVIQRSVRDLLAFKDKLEGLMSGADSNVERANDTLSELVAFKQMVQEELPQLQKAVRDAERAAVDVAQLTKEVHPIIEWVQAKQKAEAEAAAAADKAKEEPPADQHQDGGAADQAPAA